MPENRILEYLKFFDIIIARLSPEKTNFLFVSALMHALRQHVSAERMKNDQKAIEHSALTLMDRFLEQPIAFNYFALVG